MEQQFFSLNLVGLKNVSLYPVLACLGRQTEVVEPHESMELDFATPDRHHAFKVLMVQDDVTFVFFISKTAHKLHVSDGVGKGAVDLDVLGTDGKFRIYVESGAITIEDASDVYVLKYKKHSTRYYRFIASDADMEVRPYNHMEMEEEKAIV